MKIHYIDAVCGSGKTTTLLEHHSKFGANTLLLQPTKNLINSTAETYKSDFIKGKGEVIKLYAQDENSWVNLTEENRPVYERFNEHAQATPKDKSKTLTLMTHASLLKAPILLCKDKFDLVIDETIAIDNHIQLTLPINHQHLAQYIDVVDANIEYYELKPKAKCGEKIKFLSENAHNDSIEKALADLWIAMSSKHYKVFCRKKQWNVFGLETKTAKRYKDRLDIHTVLMPTILEGWNSVRIMAANFEKSFMFSIWEALGVEWLEEKNIRPKITKHLTNKRLSIYYMSDQRNTRYLQEKKAGDNAVKDKANENIKELFGDEDFIWFNNNRHDDEYIESKKGTRVSNYSHGLNQYRHINNAVFLSALNNSKEHISFLQDTYGFIADEIYQARAYEAAYQCIMRTSLRLANETTEVKALVVDKGLAEFLALVLPGSKIIPASKEITLIEKEKIRTSKQVSKTATERGKLKRKRDELLKNMQELLQINREPKYLLYYDIPVPSFSPTNTSTYDFRSASGTELEFSVFAEILRKKNSGDILKFNSWDAFVIELHNWFTNKISAKDQSFLINGVKYNKNKVADTNYGTDNIEYINSIWLDIDKGELYPEDISALLGEINKIKHVMFNSYSHKSTKVTVGNQKKYINDESSNSFRVMIPFKYPVTAEVAELIWDQLAKIITDDGFYVCRPQDNDKCPKNLKISGLDKSKRTAASIFYVPNQGRRPECSFFNVDHWLQHDFLDPMDWIKNNTVWDQPDMIETPLVTVLSPEMKKLVDSLSRNSSSSNPVQDELFKEQKLKSKINEAKDLWLSTPAGSHNDTIYKVGLKLRAAGLTGQKFIDELASIGQLYSNEYGYKKAKLILKHMDKKGIQ